MSTLKEKFSRLWNEVRKGNYDYFFDALAGRLPTLVFSYWHFWLVSVEEMKLQIPDRPDLWRRQGSPADIDMLTALGLKPEVVKSRFDRGHRAFMVGKGDEVLAVVWGSLGNNEFPGPGAYFAYGAFTRPDVRGQGLTSILEDMIHRSFAAEGRSCSYATIGTLNSVSLRVHERMGFRKVGDGYYLVILGLVVVWLPHWPLAEGRIRFFLKRPPNNEKLWFLP